MRITLSILVAAAFLSLIGCGVEYGDSGLKTGELRTDSVQLDDNGVESASIELKMGVGDLDIAGGAAGLVDGKLEYNVPAWKPVVTQSKDGTTARLRIEQPSSSKSGGSNTRNRWSLKVSNRTPVAFDIQCGVGKANLNLGDLKLKDVVLKVEVGQIDMDLRGHPQQDYKVTIEGGVGSATVYLPAEAAVRANVETGIGSVKVEGLDKRGDVWESPNYGKAKATIALNVQGGIGEIRIVRATESN